MTTPLPHSTYISDHLSNHCSQINIPVYVHPYKANLSTRLLFLSLFYTIQAKRIGNLLESRCVAKEKSHILSADSPPRSASDPCTKSYGPESASPDVHFSLHRQTDTISSFSESRPPPLPARSHPFLRNKSNTFVTNLTTPRQELDEKSTQRRRLNSLPSSRKHESNEYGGNQQTLLKSKASTLGPATSQTLPAKMSVVTPPPIPTRQTCSDVETKISVLEEEIAKMQDEVQCVYVHTYNMLVYTVCIYFTYIGTYVCTYYPSDY